MEQQFLIKNCDNFNELDIFFDDIVVLINLLHPKREYTRNSLRELLDELIKDSLQVVLILDKSNNKLAAMGCHLLKNSLSWGTYLYVSDFVIALDYRKKGLMRYYAKYLDDIAIISNCDSIRLNLAYDRVNSLQSYIKAGGAMFGHHLVFDKQSK